jgi:hypothetical protein
MNWTLLSIFDKKRGNRDQKTGGRQFQHLSSFWKDGHGAGIPLNSGIATLLQLGA